MAEGVVALSSFALAYLLASISAIGTACTAAAPFLLFFSYAASANRIIAALNRLFAMRRPLALDGRPGALDIAPTTTARATMAHHASPSLLVARATTTHISLGTVWRRLDPVRRTRGASGRGKVRPLTFLSLPLAARSHREPVPSLTSCAVAAGFGPSSLVYRPISLARSPHFSPPLDSLDGRPTLSQCTTRRLLPSSLS